MGQFSYSELDCYRQCRFKHQLAYHERWKSKEMSRALDLGGRMHEVLEAHYAALMGGESRVGVENAGVKKLLEVCALDQDDAMHEQMRWMYEGYCDCYGDDGEWEILKTEEWIEVDVGEGMVLVGKIDLQVKSRESGDIWVVDHKTCKDLPKDLELDLDDQLALYIWGKRQQGVKIRGGIQSSLRKEKLVRKMTMQERFSRKMTFRTDLELETMVKEARELMIEAEANRGPGDRPRSPDTKTCGWKCDFTSACLHGRKYGGTKAREFLVDTNFKQETDAEKTARRKRMGA